MILSNCLWPDQTLDNRTPADQVPSVMSTLEYLYLVKSLAPDKGTPPTLLDSEATRADAVE